MGGNTLHSLSPRMEAAEYHAFAGRTLERLRSVTTQARIEVIPAYGRKPSFGDMDLVIDYGPPAVAQANRKAVLDALDPTEMSTMDEVTSVSVRADAHSAAFQLDLIEAEAEYFNFTLRFFSFNDLGNLLNRVANLAGFKLGQCGLRYIVRHPGNVHHVLDEQLVTTDWDAALQLLGYDPTAYAAGAAGGFQCLEDIFAFVMSGPYTLASTFLPENMDHASRIRDSKRPTYEAFLTWLDNACDPEIIARGYDWSDRDARRAEFVEHARQTIPSFSRALEGTVERHQRALEAKKIMGPGVVARHTGTWGKELADILRQIDSRFDCTDARVDWILSASRGQRSALMSQAHRIVMRHFSARA